jgi:DNA-binding CsgD family transcriptional regulator
MGTSAYLRESTSELLDAIEQELPLESKATIIHRALEVYADTLFDLSSRDTSQIQGLIDAEHIRESNDRSTQYRIRFYADEKRIDAPESIGEYELGKCSYDSDEIRIKYNNDSGFCILQGNLAEDDFYPVGRFVDGENVESVRFNDIAPAVAQLNAMIAPLGDTHLSAREYVVWLLTRSYSHTQVGEWLEKTENTVNAHLSNVTQKRHNAQQTLNLLGTHEQPQSS